MNPKQAETEYYNERRTYNKQYEVLQVNKKRIDILSNDKKNSIKKKEDFSSDKVSFEKRLQQVNEIINNFSISDSIIESSNSIIRNAQNEYQNSIISTLETANLFNAFKIDDMYSNLYTSQSLEDLKIEKQRIEEAIVKLNSIINELEIKISNADRTIGNLENESNIAIKKMNNAQANMEYYKRYF